MGAGLGRGWTRRSDPDQPLGLLLWGYYSGATCTSSLTHPRLRPYLCGQAEEVQVPLLVAEQKVRAARVQLQPVHLSGARRAG
jgi:hypothetical protein